ncbi:MAG TPA: DNA polymerase III subunit delta, partial [Casimicrobiaceae bacterium]|nr:DNA polymerase III subunit delta [Casimicrobiaceae bacterium]
RATKETIAFLIERCEGNLLAARQEIEKLALLLPAGELDHDAVEHAVADVARYDVFQLSEAWLAGDGARALHILHALQSEGEAITLIVWQLGEDLHAVAGVLDAVKSGTPIAAAVRNSRVWGKRQNALERAVRRMSYNAAIDLIEDLGKLDALAKGLGLENAWDVLGDIALRLAGVSIAIPRPHPIPAPPAVRA